MAKGFARESNWSKHAESVFKGFAMLLLLDPSATLADLAEAITDLDRRELRLARDRLAELDEAVEQAEIELMEARQTGRGQCSVLVVVP